MAHKVIPWKEGNHQIRLFLTAADAADYACNRFGELSGKAISDVGLFSVALSGGNTPVELYRELGRQGRSFDWAGIHVFLVDERWVSLSDSRSNIGMIRETLLDVVPVLPINVHPVPTDLADPEAAAARYEETIRRFFGCRPDVIPALDFVLLGLGEDGHTASLFPGSPVLAEKIRLVREVVAEQERLARITMTLPLINAARHVFVLVTGRQKAPILRRLIEGEGPTIPASLVAPVLGDLTVLCDADAASLLTSL